MYRLGYATIVWTDAAKGEKFDPGVKYREPPCPESLRLMREAMIRSTTPRAMVCIGGMEGVEREAEIFRNELANAPIYTLERTGGASLRLAQQRKDVRVIDSEIMRRIEGIRAELHPREPSVEISKEDPRGPAVPYPLIMQTIVDEVSERRVRTTKR